VARLARRCKQRHQRRTRVAYAGALPARAASAATFACNSCDAENDLPVCFPFSAVFPCCTTRTARLYRTRMGRCFETCGDLGSIGSACGGVTSYGNKTKTRDWRSIACHRAGSACWRTERGMRVDAGLATGWCCAACTTRTPAIRPTLPRLNVFYRVARWRLVCTRRHLSALRRCSGASCAGGCWQATDCSIVSCAYPAFPYAFLFAGVMFAALTRLTYIMRARRLIIATYAGDNMRQMYVYCYAGRRWQQHFSLPFCSLIE